MKTFLRKFGIFAILFVITNKVFGKAMTIHELDYEQDAKTALNGSSFLSG